MPGPIEDSIFDELKEMVGQEADDDSFDIEIKNHINSIFFTLNQLGVGPTAGFAIADRNTLWMSFTANNVLLNAVKSYMYARLRLLFDPPTNSFLVESLQKQITETEWRLNVLVEPGPNRPEDVDD